MSAAAAAPLVELVGVHRRFGAVPALAGLDLAIRAGDRIALVGENGAGKTTALRVLTGVVEPDLGEVRRAPDLRIGYLPEQAPVPVELEVGEFLVGRARLKGVAASTRGAEVARVIAAVGLGGLERRVLGTLSKGQRQRAGLADALLGEPALVVLDEPTVGLDPVQVRELRATLAALPATRGVVMSTHALADLEAIATRIVVVARGRVVVDTTPAAARAAAPGGGLDDALIAAMRGSAAP
ncbi:MAG: ABC transporter ATP-binding protein [Kofleriaceae bacterium]